jgi:ribosomal protein S14
MKYLKKKDLLCRVKVNKKELKSIILKTVFRVFFSKFRRFPFIDLRAFNNVLNKSKTRFNYRCVQTGRGRGVLRYFNLSRHKIRELITLGHISGFKKSV